MMAGLLGSVDLDVNRCAGSFVRCAKAGRSVSAHCMLRILGVTLTRRLAMKRVLMLMLLSLTLGALSKFSPPCAHSERTVACQDDGTDDGGNGDDGGDS